MFRILPLIGLMFVFSLVSFGAKGAKLKYRVMDNKPLALHQKKATSSKKFLDIPAGATIWAQCDRSTFDMRTYREALKKARKAGKVVDGKAGRTAREEIAKKHVNERWCETSYKNKKGFVSYPRLGLFPDQIKVEG